MLCLDKTSSRGQKLAVAVQHISFIFKVCSFQHINIKNESTNGGRNDKHTEGRSMF